MFETRMRMSRSESQLYGEPNPCERPVCSFIQRVKKSAEKETRAEEPREAPKKARLEIGRAPWRARV